MGSGNGGVHKWECPKTNGLHINIKQPIKIDDLGFLPLMETPWKPHNHVICMFCLAQKPSTVVEAVACAAPPQGFPRSVVVPRQVNQKPQAE